MSPSEVANLVHYADRVASRFADRFGARWYDDWEMRAFYEQHLSPAQRDAAYPQAEEEWLTGVRGTCLERARWRQILQRAFRSDDDG